ncbi:MAG: CBS domain-containing protein [Chloroflexaceae bacterium]|nr:CBS domain-containing protein [Chloroflexaceae bacterium]
MDVILCHETADFDALGAAVGLSRLWAGARVVLPGGAHPGVKAYLSLYRNQFDLIERRSVNPQELRRIAVVDTQRQDRLGKSAPWLGLPGVETILVYDHHLTAESDIAATAACIEAVGATTTLVAEQLQSQAIALSPMEATVMALGIHADTGSLTYEQTTPRDAAALAWLMGQGAQVKIIAEYLQPSFNLEQQQLLAQALDQLQQETVRGYTLAWVLLDGSEFVPGLSRLASTLLDLIEGDALLLAHRYSRARGQKLTLIGRSQIPQTDLQALLAPYGGGGHAQAASATLTEADPENRLRELLKVFKAQIPHPLLARDLMSSPVRTIRPETTIEQARRILLRYGHSGLCVADGNDQLVGVISRRDLDLALHHGMGHAPVKGYMSRNLKTIGPLTTLPDIETLMVTYDVGRLPVVDQGTLLGIVTRTDLLRHLHQTRPSQPNPLDAPARLSCLLPQIAARLAPAIWELLQAAADRSEARGWHLYLVGGAVRDLLLAETEEVLLLQDLDLVVDGFHQAATAGAGVELARELQQRYGAAHLSVHGEFQTAALSWHQDPALGSLLVDIATARTEFYPYPAANPEVEACSIRQDLYRRDFTINALAVRLTQPRGGELLDFFGGLVDLRSRLVRVLHANSFIEDPTRIYRAVRFMVRLGFTLEVQTEDYIHYAIESGVYERSRLANQVAPALTTRLKAELKYILQAPYWRRALRCLADLDALRCLHPQLRLTDTLWWQVRYLSRWLQRLDPDRTLEHWELRLETLIASLNPSDHHSVAASLQLPKDSQLRLEKLAAVTAEIQQNFPQAPVSAVVFRLRPYSLPLLLLVAVRCSQAIRRQIWNHLRYWSQIAAPLDGNDLKALGYKPGPQFKAMLDALLRAKLDGEISDRPSAQEFLWQRYGK